jgi:hypothetical protein
MYYLSIYYNLCSSKSKLKDFWIKGSGLHRHHIIPTHMGGLDDEHNYTYLTIKEHILAHFLLWKIFKKHNDLRSMKLLGANLSINYRKAIGFWCRDNKIGFHNASKEDRLKWSKKGRETQKLSNDTNSWYYWSTSEGRKKRASLGGKIGGKKQAKLGLGFHRPEIQKKAAILGGKSHIGKIWINKLGCNTRIIKEKLQEHLDDGWVLGFKKKASSSLA